MRILIFIASFLFLSGFTGIAEYFEPKNWAYQLQNANPEEISKSGFELFVMDYSRDGSEKGEYSKEDLERIKKSGVIPVAYLSIGEAEDYRFYWKGEWNENPPKWLGKENKNWKGNYAVKYWMEEWKKILREYIDRIIAAGFKGLYLDKVDEYEHWADPSSGEKEHYPKKKTAKWMAELIVWIAMYAREKAGESFLIIPQNGEELLKYDRFILQIVSGWAAEDLFYDATRPKSQDEIDKRTFFLDIVKGSGKFVLSVDYVDNGKKDEENLKRIRDYIKRAREREYIPYAALSDRKLGEINRISGVQP